MDETILERIDAWDEVASQMLESSREILEPGLTPSQRAERIRSESFVLSLGGKEGVAHRNPETGKRECVVHRIGALGCAERIRNWCFQQQCPIDCGPLFAFQSIVHELIEGYARTAGSISERTRKNELDAIEDLFIQCDRVVEDIEAFARVRVECDRVVERANADGSRECGTVSADDSEPGWTEPRTKKVFRSELKLPKTTWLRMVESGDLVIENEGGNPRARKCRIRMDCYQKRISEIRAKAPKGDA